MDLANRVRMRREELGLSQEDLALRMGYSSRTSVNKIENGRPCSQKIIARLSEALGVSIPYLMGWDEEEKEQPITLDGLSDELVELIGVLKELPQDKILALLQLAKSMQ